MAALPSAPVAGVDVGGTFTDAVVVGADGRPRMVKSTTTPEDQSVGLLTAVTAAADGDRVRAIAHGTTTATNAVLQRDLCAPVCLVTEGFADLLTIARQDRPSLYDLSRTRPDPVIPAERIIPVAERLTVDGRVLVPLDDAEVARVVAAVRDLEADAVAIVLLFSWADPRHERRLAEAIARALPQIHLTVSADLVGSFREYERASTCALNAAIGPLMSRYLGRLAERTAELAGRDPAEGADVDPLPISVMTSGGGTADLARMVTEPVHTLLSGPAAGVVAAAACARDAGFADAVAFDMGGTSTDVCLIVDGAPAIDQRGQIDGLPIGTPTVGIHTVGAGGGSIASIDAGGALQVGPRSAGADPGPACYGHGGTQPTVTDAHAVLGHLTELAGGSVRPDVDAARRAIEATAGVSATGIIAVVRAQMARALRRVTTEAGIDPAGLALVAYGGAGPLHASALARMLGCAAAVLPPAPGVLSAVGLLIAPQRRELSQTVMAEVDADLSAACAELADRLDVEVDAADWAIDVRYLGQAHELRIPLDPSAPGSGRAAAFTCAHEAAYGYAMGDTPVQIVTVHAVSAAPPLIPGGPRGWDLGPASPASEVEADLGEGLQTVAVHARGSLTAAGTTVEGPAIITQPDSTALLLPGDTATVDHAGNLVVRFDDPRRTARTATEDGLDEAARLQVLRHALDGTAELMGVALQRSAYSPNITERLDLSAALFGPDGAMVAQAEHIPVHLGSMPASVRSVLDAFDLEPGMTAIVNDPYTGGSHLPDMTLVTAVGDGDGRLLGYVANRAHHADVAGAAPGSMPADAIDIAMEGLRVPPTLLVDRHGERSDVIDLIAANSRTPEERLGDLRAQFAANHAGGRRLAELAAERGTDALLDAMTALLDHAERRMREAVAAMPDGSWNAEDVLEIGDGLVLSATVTVEGETLTVDLRGCPAQVAANLNAVRAVSESAALYVLRVLADPAAPANTGAARVLRVLTTPGTITDATFPAPVAIGNVETSQRLVDLVFRALAEALPDRVPAASQGTMNNILIGSRGVGATFAYYETIGGGEGATPDRAGMHGVHTAMTNTRNTPVEALELAYPLRVVRSELRRGTGGCGRHAGGDGVIREIEVLATATVTLQTERRTVAPWGLAGGAEGTVGRNTLLTADGDVRPLPARTTIAVQAGDRIRVETPGGGGWGPVAATTSEGQASA